MIFDCVPVTRPSFVPTKPTHEILQELSAATTLRQIYSLPFPCEAPVILPQELDIFTREPDDFAVARASEDETGSAVEWLHNDFGGDIKEAIDIIRDFDRVSIPNATKKMDFDLRGPRDERSHHTVLMPHADGATMPWMRVYFYASADPTYIIPHDKILSLIENTRPALLDMPFGDPQWYRSFAETCMDLSGAFYRSARPMREKQLTVITGATLHFMPSCISPDRRFLRGRIYEVK